MNHLVNYFEKNAKIQLFLRETSFLQGFKHKYCLFGIAWLTRLHTCQAREAVIFLKPGICLQNFIHGVWVILGNILEPISIWKSPYACTMQNMRPMVKILKEKTASGGSKNGFLRFLSFRVLGIRDVNFIILRIKNEFWEHPEMFLKLNESFSQSFWKKKSKIQLFYENLQFYRFLSINIAFLA